MPGMMKESKFRVYAQDELMTGVVNVYMYVDHPNGDRALLTSVEKGVATFETLTEGVAPEHPTMTVTPLLWDALRDHFLPVAEEGPLVTQLKSDLGYERERNEWLMDTVIAAGLNVPRKSDTTNNAWVGEDEEPF